MEKIVLQVKKINPVGTQDYPAMRNINTGRIYVDTCLGIVEQLKHDETGHNKHGEYVAYNIPGRWCTFTEEPESPLKQSVFFEVVS